MKFCVKKLQRRDEDQCEAIDTEIPNSPDADMRTFSVLGFWLRIGQFFKQKLNCKIHGFIRCDSSPEINSAARVSETLSDGKQWVPQSYIFVALVYN